MHGTTVATNALGKAKVRGADHDRGFSRRRNLGGCARRCRISTGASPFRWSRGGCASRSRSGSTTAAASIALDEAAAVEVIDRVLATAPDAIAVCLINASQRSHEARFDSGSALAIHDAISISSELPPEIREYERTSTTVELLRAAAGEAPPKAGRQAAREREIARP
jgi:N-methylhydantoinase A/oxoprolinase/acetone carboxylase beta subunit